MIGADGGVLVSGARWVRFRVPGRPEPQGSKTVGRTRAGRSFVREDNPRTVPWRSAVALAAREAMNGEGPLVGALLVEAAFRFARPRSHYGTGRNAGRLKPSAPLWVAVRPDLDKLLRALGDAITGVVCVDDAQIAELGVTKVYGQPGLEVTVYEIDVDNFPQAGKGRR